MTGKAFSIEQDNEKRLMTEAIIWSFKVDFYRGYVSSAITYLVNLYIKNFFSFYNCFFSDLPTNHTSSTQNHEWIFKWDPFLSMLRALEALYWQLVPSILCVLGVEINCLLWLLGNPPLNSRTRPAAFLEFFPESNQSVLNHNWLEVGKGQVEFTYWQCVIRRCSHL